MKLRIQSNSSEADMKAIKILLSIFGIGFLLLMALGSLLIPAYLSAALFFILVFWISPLSKSLKESFANTIGKKILSFVVCVILFVVAVGAVPSNGRTQNASEETVENEVADSEEPIVERSIPEEQDYIESSTDDLTSPSSNTSTDLSNAQNDYNIVVADSSNDTSNTSSNEIQSSENTLAVNQNTNSQENSTTQQASGSSAAQTTDAPTTQVIDTPVTQPTTVTPAQSSDDSSSQSSSGGNDDNTYNFNLYNTPEQQQTTETWVLNTSSMKIHHPGCSSVPSIKPENYAVSSKSLQELMAMGYTTCGRCFK